MSKQKYLVVRRGPTAEAHEEPAKPRPSPEAMQAMMEKHRAWMDEYADQIVDPGARLASGGRVLTDDGVVDGPFVEGKELLGGYMILECETYEEAIEVMRAGPAGMLSNGSMEIRALIPQS